MLIQGAIVLEDSRVHYSKNLCIYEMSPIDRRSLNDEVWVLPYSLLISMSVILRSPLLKS